MTIKTLLIAAFLAIFAAFPALAQAKTCMSPITFVETMEQASAKATDASSEFRVVLIAGKQLDVFAKEVEAKLGKKSAQIDVIAVPDKATFKLMREMGRTKAPLAFFRNGCYSGVVAVDTDVLEHAADVALASPEGVSKEGSI